MLAGCPPASRTYFECYRAAIGGSSLRPFRSRPLAVRFGSIAAVAAALILPPVWVDCGLSGPARHTSPRWLLVHDPRLSRQSESTQLWTIRLSAAPPAVGQTAKFYYGRLTDRGPRPLAISQKIRRAKGRRRMTQLVNAKEARIAPVTVAPSRSHFGAGASMSAHCSSSTNGMWKT